MSVSLDGYMYHTHDGAYAEWDERILQETHEHYNFVDYTAVQTVIDIGAHIGGFSCYVKQKAPHARVIAVEVNEESAHLLQANASPLGVMCYHARLGYKQGDFVQWQHPYISGTNGVHDVDATLPDTCIRLPLTCPTLTLEQLRKIHNMPVVDVLKIDCEGSEYDILPNADLSGIRHIVGEYHDGVERFEKEILTNLTNFEVKHLDCVTDWGLFWLASTSL